jgi:type II secretory pathway component PulK
MIRPLYASPGRARSRSGAALLLSLLILLVLVAIVMQIRIGTITDERVARNDIGLTTMDLAVESALLQVDDQLLQDAKNSGPGTPATGAPAAPATGDSSQSSSNGSAAATGTPAPASDSRKDEWARPQRTTINEIRLRILVQDEDSKINVLNMLNADEKEAQAAYDRVVRCLDLCREGTGADIDSHTADEMAKAMREYMLQRKSSKIPRPALLSDNPANQDQGLPLSLKEFAVLPPFDESHFRDFRDADGRVVHSIGSFLTVWTSVATAADAARLSGAPPPGGAAAATTPSTSSTSGSSTSSSSNGSTPPTGSGSSDPSSGGSGFDLSQSGSSAGSSSGSGTPATGSGAATPGGTPAGGSSGGVTLGGYAVNVNTAPVAVLKSLFDDRDLHPRFFDRVIEYRNTEEEKPKDAPVTDQADQPVDEYGDPIVDRKIFDSLTKLSEVDGYQDLPADVQTKLNQLLTTESHVFSIFVVARRTTSQEGDQSEIPGSRDEMRAREQAGDSLLRVVRSVVWRHKVGDDYVLTPIVRWEVLDYEPFEVQDYPDEKR